MQNASVLCDEEMIMLRYNCLTNKGRNMQEFVNQFNLIKHIPLMSLLEFKKWKAKIGGDEALVSCISFYSTKKVYFGKLYRRERRKSIS